MKRKVKKAKRVASIKSKPQKKKVESKSVVVDDKPKITKLKIWMMQNGINQNTLAENTGLSTNTVNNIVNKGKASKSIKKLISYELKLNIEQLEELLKFS